MVLVDYPISLLEKKLSSKVSDGGGNVFIISPVISSTPTYSPPQSLFINTVFVIPLFSFYHSKIQTLHLHKGSNSLSFSCEALHRENIVYRIYPHPDQKKMCFW